MAAKDPIDVANSAQEARAKGFGFFCTGIPCKNGHISPQRLSNYGCIQCQRDSLTRRRQEAKTKRAADMPAPAEPDRVISRKTAAARGLVRYFTGYPCKRGHVTERLVADKTCMECDRARRAASCGAKPDAVRKQRERSSAYYQAHREELIEQQKRRNEKNAESIRVKRIAHRMANKTRINAKIAEWAKANPAKRRAKERAREGRERGAEGTHTWADIEAIKVVQNGLCAVPGCDRLLADGFHVDHVIPISKGGSNWPANLQLLCPPHNQSKATKDNVLWLLEQAEKE